MKKVIFETVGNTIAFILFGLTLTSGLLMKKENQSVSIEANWITSLFIIFLVIYLITMAIINKRQKGSIMHLFTGLQLYKDTDERDRYITGEAAKTTYLTMFALLGPVVIIPFVLHFYAVLFDWNVNFYTVSI